MAQQIAQVRYLRIAPRKVRLVADLVRGLSVNEAEAQLLHERRRAAQSILKLLRSAAANAKNNKKLDVATLVIERIHVDQGPMLKRYLPRARGMATPIQKKTSHVTLVLVERTAVREPRFSITAPQKRAKAASRTPKQKKERGEQHVHDEGSAARHARRSGFLRRIFTRKSGM